MFLKSAALVASLGAALVSGSASAATINLGLDGITGQRGNLGGWVVTAAGAVNQTPYNLGPNALALTSTGFDDGTPVPGASQGNFDGFASFSTTFVLPSSARDAVLTYANLSANDRFVFELNGVVLGASGLNAPVGQVTPGTFVYTDGGAELPAAYTGTGSNSSTTLLSGTASGPFVLGGTNTLTALVNATYHGIYNDGTATGLSSGTFKGTNFGADAITVSYNVSAVPLPAGASLFGAALLVLGMVGTRRRRAAAPPRADQVIERPAAPYLLPPADFGGSPKSQHAGPHPLPIAAAT